MIIGQKVTVSNVIQRKSVGWLNITLSVSPMDIGIITYVYGETCQARFCKDGLIINVYGPSKRFVKV